MTQQTSIVQDVEVQHLGQKHTATYFVEGNTLHAHIGGRFLVTPLVEADAGQKVRDLLTGHLLVQTRKMQQASLWRKHLR